MAECVVVVAGHRGGWFADMIRLPAMVLWPPCDGRDTEMFLAATAGGLIGIQVSILCVWPKQGCSGGPWTWPQPPRSPWPQGRSGDGPESDLDLGDAPNQTLVQS